MSFQPATEEKLVVTVNNQIKRIIFNRPKRRNAIDFETFEKFAEAVERTESDGTRVLIITGAGDSFCSGLDLSSLGTVDLSTLDVAEKIRELINPPVRRLRSLPVPVIARIHGPTSGIGFSYVLASDIRIASDEAVFSQSFVKVGLMPDGGSSFFLPRLIGYPRAFELIATGAAITSEQAFEYGIVNQVVTFSELDAVVDELASRLAGTPQPAIANIKRALSAVEAADLDRSLELEAVGQAECFSSRDFREGMTAFMEKRPPAFGK